MSRPRNPFETLRANARPAPALPAPLVLLATFAFANALPGWLGLLGLAASCGLAVAAGARRGKRPAIAESHMAMTNASNPVR